MRVATEMHELRVGRGDAQRVAAADLMAILIEHVDPQVGGFAGGQPVDNRGERAFVEAQRRREAAYGRVAS
jgi:hypothetical protein